ncbi:MAG: hypothetical protein NZ770_05560 [Candidatus Poseidoniaceae archaeon]|nr:hypothetical protein [Candidatus Poseidoniaceae archaeon]
MHHTGGSISVIELLAPETWEGFLNSGTAVLILGNSGCAACEKWKLELSQWEATLDLRIAEIQLDQPRFGRFKSAHPWVADIEILPFNAIFVEGVIVEQWSGGSLPHLEERLQRFMG